MANERLKPTPPMNSSEGYYQKTQWHTGDVIVQHKMMNIEDWIASATDELLLARTGYNINRVKNSWNSLGERLDYITTSINTIVEHGIDQTVSDLIDVITEAQDAAQRADTAATLLDNMTVAARSLPAGQQAQVLDWKKESGHYSLTLGLPVPSFSVQSTTTTIDGTTPASVSVDNTELLNRKLTFSIPVPKFTVSASAITSGSITPTATGTDLNTLNPKINFGIPVSTPQIGTVTTTSTGAIDTTNILSLSDINTLNPKINLNLPVQKIADVDYDQATPGTAGDFELVNGSQLNPTLHLTVPVQNISQVTATSLAAGSQPTASLEYLDTAHLNLRLNLGLPLAEPINILHTYSTVADLQANITNDVPIGHYAIISNAATNEDNGKLYMRIETSPYYRFITDLAAATPRFAMGTINVVNADQQSVATIDVTDPANPVLNLTIPAKPLLNQVNTTVTAVGTQGISNFIGNADDLTLALTIPAIPQFNQNVNITTNGSQATGSITGTADNLQLNLNLPVSAQSNVAYLNIHPANDPSIIPFIFNDIEGLVRRGGEVRIYYDNVLQPTSTSNDRLFDGSGVYWTVNPSDKTSIQFELILHKTFSQSSIVYVDFGVEDTRAKNITIEVINSNYSQDIWTQKFNVTNNPNAHVYTTISHTPVNAANNDAGFNRIRFTFSDWASSGSFKIAEIGIYNQNSLGARETLMSRGEDDPVFRNIRPNTTETYNLGSSELKWNNVYTKQINGATVPNNPSFTDTKNTAGATNSTEKLFLIGATAQGENPQTYSRQSIYIGADGYLYSNNERVLTISDGGGSGGGGGSYTPITVNNISPDANDNITITATDITQGVFNVARIPDLAATKITSGTFNIARIPDLSADKITSGSFVAARIPNLNADKITEGSFAPARLPVFQGATSSANGVKGAVPAPSAGDHLKLLCGAGSWISTVVPTADSALPVSAGSVYTALQGKQDNLQFDPTPRTNSHNPVWSEGIYDALALKQDNLDFDNAPTANSQNILTSGTIYEALDNKQDSFDFDNTPVQYSTNAITSGAVYEALQSVSSGSITLDNTVTQNSQNGVKSSGIYAALALKLDTSAVESSPIQNSNNPISSGAMYTALANKMPLIQVDNTVTQNSSALITSGAVYGALANASGVGITVNNISPDANGNITITASNITGTFTASQIPNLNANKITNGTIAISRLPAFGGTNGTTDGSAGIVPGPLSSDYGKVFSSNGSWQFIEDMITLDSTPTFGSTNLVNSTGIYNSLTTKVSKTGDTMTGDLTLINTSKIYFSSIDNNVQDNYFRIQYYNRRFLIQEYIAGGNSSDGYNNYQLPIPDGDKKTYDILTTKDIIGNNNKFLMSDSSSDSKMSWHSVFTLDMRGSFQLANNTDANNAPYGISYVASQADMRTIINNPHGADAPYGGQFITIKSYYDGETYKKQFFINAGNNLFVRRLASSNNWDEWHGILHAPLSLMSDNVIPRFNSTNGSIQGSKLGVQDNGITYLSVSGEDDDIYPAYTLRLDTKGTINIGALLLYGNTYQTVIRERHPDSSSYYEAYRFPTPDSTRTQSEGYDILTTKTVTFMDNQSAGPLGWTSRTTDGEYIPTINTIAYWNGRYNSSASNLQYCKLGAFGSIVTAAAADYVDVTSDQTVAGVKTFTSAPVIDLSATATAAETSKVILSFKYQNPNEKVKTVNIIRTYGDSEDGTANGVAIIGSHNGSTVIGAGEGVINAIKLQLSNIGSTEQIALIADGAINFFTNAGSDSNAATNVRKVMTMTPGGQVHIPQDSLSIVGSSFPMIRFRNAENSNNEYGAIFANISNGNLILRQRMSGTYYENYHLPSFNTSGTSAIDYFIVTDNPKSITEFTNNVTFTVAKYNAKFVKQGNICHIEYMSASKSGTWAQGELLFTLPTNYRPKVPSYFIGALGSAPYPALIGLATDGKVTLYSSPTYPSGGRMYLNFSYCIV